MASTHENALSVAGHQRNVQRKHSEARLTRRGGRGQWQVLVGVRRGRSPGWRLAGVYAGVATMGTRVEAPKAR